MQGDGRSMYGACLPVGAGTVYDVRCTMFDVRCQMYEILQSWTFFSAQKTKQ